MIDNFQATVIGSGPAGIITVCQLLKHNITPIAWVDPQFNIGGLCKYKDIPSNTKIKYQLTTAANIGWVDKFPELGNPQSVFSQFDAEETCELEYSYKMFNIIQSILDQTTQKLVIKYQTTVHKILVQDGLSEIHLSNQIQFVTKYVFNCTGSSRNTYQSVSPTLLTQYPHLTEIDLFDGMNCTQCVGQCNEQDIVGIFGNSHSGMLACMNLCECPIKPQKVYVFQRRPLLFAEYLEDGRILNDSIGLKGKVADWSMKHCQNNNMRVEMIQSSGDEYKEYMNKCTKFIVATGFHRNVLPELQIDGNILVDNKVGYDDCTMQLKYGGDVVENNYGFGIAFPEKVLDANGTHQHAVGFYKFLKTVTRIINGLVDQQKQQ